MQGLGLRDRYANCITGLMGGARDRREVGGGRGREREMGTRMYECKKGGRAGLDAAWHN